jgi:homocysteine S-methyltransferase
MTSTGDIPIIPRTFLVDGGLSTQLESQGVDLKQHPQLWTAGLLSSDHGRKQLSTAHTQFLNAGSDIILTASYQVSPECNQLVADFSVSLALAARDAASNKEGLPAKVFVSLGPWGATQADGSEYTGKYDKHVTKVFLKDWHTRRLELLLKNNSGVDGLAFETIPSMLELGAIVEVLGATKKAGWTTFSSSDGIHLCDGTPIEDAFELCDKITKVDDCLDRYFGLNCVHPDTINPFLDVVVPLAAISRGSINGIAVYPNNGGTWDAEGRCWKDAEGQEGEGFSLLAKEWKARVEDAGLNFVVGGCCSTDAKTIRKLKENLV